MAPLDAAESRRVVPREAHTIESLVAQIAAIAKRQGASPYRISRVSGLTLGAVKHLFFGYAKTTEGREGLVRDPERVGRVQLATFLKIVQALGYDVELVRCEQPGREEA